MPVGRALVFLIFGGVISCVSWSFYEAKYAPVPTTSFHDTDDKESAKAAIEKNIKEARFRLGMVYARALKKAMKNPDSFKLEQALRMADGTFCFQYRATNSFNAIVPGQAFVGSKGKSGVSDGSGRFASQWNRYCGGKSGDNFSTIVFAINDGL